MASLVEKATSDLLIGPDWGMNLEICDAINGDPGQAREVVKAIKKRLGNKNGKVQLWALVVLETIMKNCGEIIHHSVAEKDILPEMVKIVKKKTDMSVRDKILVLLDSWQEAFGGISGRYPQYYMAYDDLRRCGVEFPERDAESAVPMFTPPPTHPQSFSSSFPNARHGSPPYVSTTLEDVMAVTADGRHVWSSKDMDRAQSELDVLNDMLNAIDPHDKQAVKDEVIVQLVDQCRTSQNGIMNLVNSTSDEQLLCQGLALNDEMQRALAKYDAIVAGATVSTVVKSASPKRFPVYAPEDDEAEDDFSQLAHKPSSRPNRASSSQEGRSPSSAPFALPPPPQPIRKLNPPPGTKGKTVDLLSGESLKDSSPKTPGALASPANAALTSPTKEQLDDSLYNPFAPGSTFTAIPPQSTQQQRIPISENPVPHMNISSQYLQELDYSGYVAPWSSVRPESSALNQHSGMIGNHQQRGSYNPQIEGQHLPPTIGSPTNYAERHDYFPEQTDRTTYATSSLNSLEEQTKNLGFQDAEYQRSQGSSIGNFSASGSVSDNQRLQGTTKGASPSQNANPADRLFEDLVDFQGMSANFKKAGMSSSLTKPNKSKSTGI